MVRTLTKVVLGILLGAVSAASVSPQGTSSQGERVFTDQKCGLCHSIGGKGNTKGPLDDVGSKLSADDIRAWIVDAKGMTARTKAPRKPEMRAYSLAKEDVDALVVYLSAMKKK